MLLRLKTPSAVELEHFSNVTEVLMATNTQIKLQIMKLQRSNGKNIVNNQSDGDQRDRFGVHIKLQLNSFY